jgi:hypothetical protein
MKRVAIIGRGSRWECGYTDPGEKWVVSSAFFRQKGPADKIFQIHATDVWEEGLKNERYRVVLAYSAPGFESCEKLPYKAILDAFGPVLSSSVGWMLAYALFLGYDEIALYGVDMIADYEYGSQRDYLFYLIGWARSRGINVIMQEYAGVYLYPETYAIPVTGQ